MSLDIKDSYRDNPLLKKAGVKINFTKEQVQEYVKCSRDPVYFAEHYIKIVNVDQGLISFKMWDFQKDMICVYHENRFSITKCPRQVGKTTTSVAYLLWLTLFSDTQNIAVLANKGSLARDILAKYQLAYENLPMWLQQGVVTWNKGNVELENGSKILAASTSSSAVRGGSFNCVDGKGKTIVKINNKIIEITMENLYSVIANSSKYFVREKDEVTEYVHEEQIHKMVHEFDGEGLFIVGLSERIAPHNTKKSWWGQLFRKFSEIANKTAHLSSSFVDKDDNRRTSKENGFSLCHDDSYENWGKIESSGISANKNSIERVSNKQSYVGKHETENFEIQNGAGTWYQKARGIFKENIGSFNWKKEVEGTHRKNKQESRKNKENCGKTSWYEKSRGNETENERCEKELYPMEQRKDGSLFTRNFGKNEKFQTNEIENIEVLTEDGFKKFYGIKRTKNQKTIKLIIENQHIICTPDHKIMTTFGYVEAKNCLNKKVLSKDSTYKIVSEIQDYDTIDVYDFLEVNDTHSYYYNDILVHQCVFLDEFAFVPTNIADDFFNSVYPVISSGKTTKIIIVSTPNGMNLFYKLWMDAIGKKNGYKPFEIHWSMVPGRDEKWKEETIRNTSEDQFRQEFESLSYQTLINIDNTEISIGELYDKLYSDR
jgi:hypothetical protein